MGSGTHGATDGLRPASFADWDTACMHDYTFVGPPLYRPDSLIPNTPVTRTSRALRPIGYFLLALVWLAIVGIAAFVWVILPSALAASGPLSAAPGITKLATDPGEAIAAIIALLIAALPFGFVLAFISIASVCLCLLSFVYFARSLNPAFAGERLSTTLWTAEAIGPVRLGGAAIGAIPVNQGFFARYRPVMGKAAVSLIPVRRTRLVGALSTGMFFSLVPSWKLVFASFPLGVAYLVTVAWVLWPVRSPAIVVIWVIVSLVLAAVSVLVIIRAIRAQIRSWHRQPTNRSADAASRVDAS